MSRVWPPSGCCRTARAAGSRTRRPASPARCARSSRSSRRCRDPDPAVASGAVSAEGSSEPRPAARGVARNTAIFSVLTGLSRIMGLIREIVASSYFGTSGAFSAFTIAFQLPNLVRSLFADAALSAAFVPVFTEMLEKGQKRDAVRLASTLFFIILAVLGGATVVFVLGANVIVPIFTGDQFSAHLDSLTTGLAQVMFPIVVLLALNGLLVGI